MNRFSKCTRRPKFGFSSECCMGFLGKGTIGKPLDIVLKFSLYLDFLCQNPTKLIAWNTLHIMKINNISLYFLTSCCILNWTKQLLENTILFYFTSLYFTHFHTINFTSLLCILRGTKQSLSLWLRFFFLSVDFNNPSINYRWSYLRVIINVGRSGLCCIELRVYNYMCQPKHVPFINRVKGVETQITITVNLNLLISCQVGKSNDRTSNLCWQVSFILCCVKDRRVYGSTETQHIN